MTDEFTLTIRCPDDWHLHFRDGDVMRGVVPHTARQFSGDSDAEPVAASN